MISSFFAKEDSNTDISQIINKTKAAQAKSAATIIDGLN